jgi:hypothetical protein
MATHTIVALFDDYREADSAVRDLEAAGVPSSDINMIANNAGNRYGDYPQYAADRSDTTDTGSAAGTGAGIGAVLGGAAGLLAGIGALAIPGVGPVVAAGALAATLAGAGVGAAVGGLVGALVDAGIPREHADIYAEAVRRGGSLVTVRADDAMRDRITDLLDRHTPVDIEERADSWRQTGWTRFDEQAEPYTGGPFREDAAATAPAAHTPPTGSLPEGEPAPSGSDAANRLQRDWEVRRDDSRARQDTERTAVRIYPRTEEAVGDKR